MRSCTGFHFLPTGKHYYAAKSYMGISMSFDSPCWTVYAFDTKTERDTWVRKNAYKDGNQVSEAITAKEMRKILGSGALCWDDHSGYPGPGCIIIAEPY